MRSGRRLTRLVPWCLSSLICAAVAGPAVARAALHVIPFPDTPDASPLSHVIFSSLHRSQLRSVTVTGSSSGAHPGHLISLPDDAGTAFVPDQPFTGGERVSVTAMLTSPAAGTASGEPGGTSLRFSFTVDAVPGPGAAGAARGPQPARRGNRYAARPGMADQPTQSFRSAPSLHPPVISATGDPDLSSGDIFLGPTHTAQSLGGPMILDGQGRLVWFDPIGYTASLEVQHYQGHPVLTWWQGKSLAHGEGVIVDRSYQIVKIVHAGYGYGVDSHEFQLTGHDTAFIDAVELSKADLSAVGGNPYGSVSDNLIQEVDIRTGQVLWEWHAFGHVPLGASHQPVQSRNYDYFHLNSIQQLPGGNLIVSSRNTWAVYEIDKQTGRVIWTLGGKDSTFRMRPGTNFEWQHDARLHPGGILSLFDDGALPQEERQSSAKFLRLDTSRMTASLVARYTHNPPLLSAVTGNAQVLPNGNVFVGWGSQPYFSEYTPGGRQIFTANMPPGLQSYRAFRFPWHAQPLTRPAVALARQKNGQVRVYASWNGATQVAAWRVVGGRRPGALKTLAQAPRSGFETVVVVPGQQRYVAVRALNAHGKVIGSSDAQRV